jgi:hypothetical protein
MLFKNLKKVKSVTSLKLVGKMGQGKPVGFGLNSPPSGPSAWTTTKANNSWSKLNGAKLQSFARSFNKKQGVWEKCPCC